MLLRTSSAPLLGAISSTFSHVEVCKDSIEPAPSVHGSSYYPSSSPSSPHIFRSMHLGQDICSHTHGGLGNGNESIQRPASLSRAQSEGDLACSFVPMAGTVHPSHFPNRECSSELSICSNPLLQNDHRLVLNDGETYSSLTVTQDGHPIVCNSKGCRPLTELECKQLGFLDMASGIGSMPAGAPASSEFYFQSLLETDPGNPLLLRNYAELLAKKGDVKKAEEYYERAILADPNDGEVLSSYAKLQWDVNKDQDRAEAYYDRAVQAAPDDCYVLASHASFLWGVDEDETNCTAPQRFDPGTTQSGSLPVVASA
ncbi:hypothetical protein KP509_26G006900 [Ceratopteris richardii]|uniref:Uncharacterized protein n=1 Tax=Ceratopteris richardii TaxID=49495 RepID=A0A8T2RHR3_CERRI|nr:hypothetical protein KP509_26G006900 [Ceratopteris richardii]